MSKTRAYLDWKERILGQPLVWGFGAMVLGCLLTWRAAWLVQR